MMDIQEIIVALIGLVVLAIIVRKVYRIAKGKDNACSCCSKTGCCECHCNDKNNKKAN